MPHCTIEYTDNALHDDANANTTVHDLVRVAHQAMNASGLFGADDVKTRALCVHEYALGTMVDPHASFVHVSIQMLEGRTQEQKQVLTSSVGQAIRDLLPQLTCVTVDVSDMVRAGYYKHSA